MQTTNLYSRFITWSLTSLQPSVAAKVLTIWTGKEKKKERNLIYFACLWQMVKGNIFSYVSPLYVLFCECSLPVFLLECQAYFFVCPFRLCKSSLGTKAISLLRYLCFCEHFSQFVISFFSFVLSLGQAIASVISSIVSKLKQVLPIH